MTPSKREAQFSRQVEEFQARIRQLEEEVARLSGKTSPGGEESSYRIVLESSPVPMWIDRGGTIVFINNAGLELLGASCVEQVVGRSPFDFIDPEFHELVRGRIRQIKETGGQAPTVEERFVGVDGRILDVEITATLILYQGQQSILVNFLDISGRKQDQRSIARLNQDLDRWVRDFEALMEILPIGLAISEDPECRWIRVNSAFAKMLGINPGDNASVTGSDPDNLPFKIYKDGREVPPEEMPMQVAARDGVEIREAELDIVRKDGTILKEYGFAIPLFDEQRKPRGCIGAFVDVTELKKAEQAVRTSDERLRVALSAAETGIWRWDIGANQDTRDANLNRLLGLPPVETTHSVEEFLSHVHPEDRDLVSRTLALSAREGTDYGVDMRIVRPDGKIRWLRDQGKVFWGEDGHPAYLTGACVDITDRKRLEEQLRQAQKMEAIGALAGGVAHDFNNLLTIINGYGHLLLGSLSEDRVLREYVQEIVAAGERATDLTTRLLAFSRRQVIQPKVVSLNSVVVAMEKMMARVIGEDIELKTFLSPDLGKIKADQVQMEQVLLNLAVNARDAMPTGGKLTIQTANVDVPLSSVPFVNLAPGPYVLLTVNDTGHGMDATTQSRIFEPFFTTKAQGKGTGLGLSTVYGIVTQSGGDIVVISEPGRGASFRIYLPRTYEQEEGVEAPMPPHQSHSGTCTILLVEDEAGVRRLAADVLRSAGYTVLEASGVEDAVSFCDQHIDDIELLLTDVVMPRRSGPELADDIRLLIPSLKVLYMSGYTDSRLDRHNILKPDLQILQKPFEPEELIRKVRELLSWPS